VDFELEDSVVPYEGLGVLAAFPRRNPYSFRFEKDRICAYNKERKQKPMEPRRYISLATWAKERIARLEAVTNEVVDGAEMADVEDTNVLSFTAAIELAPSPLNEAA